MNNLKNLRKQKKLSFRQLSELLNIPSRTIQDWEYEERQIQFYHRMKALAKIFGVTLEELMTKEVNCLYGGKKAVIFLTQEEDGVHIEVYRFEDDDIKQIKGPFVVSREEALQFIKGIKEDTDLLKLTTTDNNSK